jgi:hypothetical protein
MAQAQQTPDVFFKLPDPIRMLPEKVVRKIHESAQAALIKLCYF